MSYAYDCHVGFIEHIPFSVCARLLSARDIQHATVMVIQCRFVLLWHKLCWTLDFNSQSNKFCKLCKNSNTSVHHVCQVLNTYIQLAIQQIWRRVFGKTIPSII